MCQICDELKEDKKKLISLDYGEYTELMISYGRLYAYGEGEATIEISFCPFCGKKFETDK